MQFRCNWDLIEMYWLVLNFYLTFTDRVGVGGVGGGWLEKWGIKLSQLSTQLRLKLKLSLAILSFWWAKTLHHYPSSTIIPLPKRSAPRLPRSCQPSSRCGWSQSSPACWRRTSSLQLVFNFWRLNSISWKCQI